MEKELRDKIRRHYLKFYGKEENMMNSPWEWAYSLLTDIAVEKEVEKSKGCSNGVHVGNCIHYPSDQPKQEAEKKGNSQRPNPKNYIPTDFIRGKYEEDLEKYIDYLENQETIKDRIKPFISDEEPVVSRMIREDKEAVKIEEEIREWYAKNLNKQVIEFDDYDLHVCRVVSSYAQFKGQEITDEDIKKWAFNYFKDIYNNILTEGESMPFSEKEFKLRVSLLIEGAEAYRDGLIKSSKP